MRSASCFFLMILMFFGCRKTYNNPVVPYVFNPSPVKAGYMELNTQFFIPLLDHSFLISCKSPTSSNLDKEIFLHYDGSLNFIDSITYSEVLYFGNGVESNGRIYNVLLQSNYQRSKFQYSLREMDRNYKTSKVKDNLLDSLNIVPYRYFMPQIVRLQNGNLITGITTQESGSPKSVCLAAYSQDMAKPLLWRNDTSYASDSYFKVVLRSMAADGNSFYVMCSEYNSGYGHLRKHDENGKLIWRKKLSTFIGESMLIHGEWIVLFGSYGTVKLFDKEGNEFEGNTIRDHNIVPADGGFLGLSVIGSLRPDKKGTIFQTLVTKYNSSMVPIKTRALGDDQLHKSVLGALHDGSFVVVSSINVQGKGEHLVFYKMNSDLEDFYK